MQARTHRHTHTNTGMCRLLYYLHMDANSYMCALGHPGLERGNSQKEQTYKYQTLKDRDIPLFSLFSVILRLLISQKSAS